MRFELSHSFAAPIDDVAAVLLDLDFQATLGDVGDLKERTLLSQEPHGDGVVRRVRCVLGLEISGAAARFLGGAEPAWVQEEHWDPSTRTWEWVIHPEIAKDLLSARGEIALRDRGDHSVRSVTGEVRVHVPLYGGRVEGLIVEGITRAYDEEAERLMQWLRKGD